MGKDKGFCELNKKPLVEYSTDVLSSVCSRIIIGANTNEYIHLGFPVIHDEIKDIGPIGGIYSCLKSSKTNDNIILSCDMPLIPVALIEYILSEKAGYDAVVPVFNDLPEPLCAYYNKSVTSSLYESIKAEKYKIQDVLRGFKTNFLQVDSGLSFYRDNLFANINSQQDLMKLEFMMKTNKL